MGKSGRPMSARQRRTKSVNASFRALLTALGGVMLSDDIDGDVRHEMRMASFRARKAVDSKTLTPREAIMQHLVPVFSLPGEDVTE